MQHLQFQHGLAHGFGDRGGAGGIGVWENGREFFATIARGELARAAQRSLQSSGDALQAIVAGLVAVRDRLAP